MNARFAAAVAAAMVGRRVREPSTWAGVAALLALFGIEVAAEQIAAVVQAAAAVAAAAAVVLPDRPDPQPRPPTGRKPKEPRK